MESDSELLCVGKKQMDSDSELHSARLKAEIEATNAQALLCCAQAVNLLINNGLSLTYALEQCGFPPQTES
ncbi:hypothetical protein [Streptomyces sp. SID3212]|uniref:hypothetical protein n=1 Tax=Streptomyces sp. SID3212 TaxID=2690259 RepID=UPI00136E14AE|nr:hypothetical protein [Streptomyces sp. SID3212]MYV58012.1 hypothetical protein [Streptomyces sp. SID3212]